MDKYNEKQTPIQQNYTIKELEKELGTYLTNTYKKDDSGEGIERYNMLNDDNLL
ncbi:hypothetical protein PY093_02770 [Cytobacillus sp. S13-E01]|uniref:hypothetical protein n=1 Tax=Cytobacillus sp. S13-E01 TaxID=3031326 RepID=UPI0023D83005|nr:hypothetical protein [Cytobacillus sp. S13-E01]MDF0725636.1 hypothetical protein [Cytobacillus sp. S13-E01]